MQTCTKKLYIYYIKIDITFDDKWHRLMLCIAHPLHLKGHIFNNFLMAMYKIGSLIHVFEIVFHLKNYVDACD